MGLRPILLINKIDKKDARPQEVVDEVYELFLDLNASDEQLDFPILYGIAKQGIVQYDLDTPSDSIEPLFKTILKHCDVYPDLDNEPLQMQVSALAYDEYIGRLGIGRIYQGVLKPQTQYVVCDSFGHERTNTTSQIFVYRGLSRVSVEEAHSGDIVVIAGIFAAIYQPSNGILNSFLEMIGLSGLTRAWMGDPDIVNYSIIVALIWQAIGYYMVMYMASMSSIPENLYEAASLEGAGKIKQFFMITLPLIWNNIRTTLTFFVISTINLSFMFVQINTEGSLGTEVPLNYMYNKAFAGNYSYGMAAGVCIFLFSFALSGILNNITKRDVLEF